MPPEGSPANVSGNTPPPKPWERVGSSSGPAPFKPPSPGNTSDVVEASGTARPGEILSNAERNTPVNRNSLGRPIPTRPWEQNYGNSYGGYGSSLNYNSSYGSGMLGSYGGGSYGGGGGLYGNSMYGRPVGGTYGGSYGGGMYNSGFGGPTGYGMGMGMGTGMGMGMGMGMGGPYGDQDPNNPFGAPPSPPGFWISFLRVMQGVVSFFGRIAILIDQNTQAFHMFMSALLQLFDRSGMLYGELARFVLRLLGVKTKSTNHIQPGPGGPLPGPDGQRYLEGPKPTGGSWDSVWDADGNKGQ